MFWQQIQKDKLAIVCLGFIVVVLAAGLFAPLISPHDPVEPHIIDKFQGMSQTYPLGTDHLGRCTLKMGLVYPDDPHCSDPA